MATLPPIRRLATEDFQSQKAWIGSLLYPLNLFIGAVSNALSKGLTFADNMAAQVNTLQVTGTYPLYVSWQLKSKPIGAWVVSAMEATPPHVNFTAAVGIDWQFSVAGQIQINAMPGLTAGKTYNVTIVTIAG